MTTLSSASLTVHSGRTCGDSSIRPKFLLDLRPVEADYPARVRRRNPNGESEAVIT